MFRLLYFVLNSVYNIIQYSYISGKIYNKGLFLKTGKTKHISMHCISKFRNGVFFIAISMLFITSCKPSPNGLKDGDDNGGYASDASKIELINNDVISMADIAGTYYTSDYIGGAGVTVATDTISVPHTLIIRFGPTDVTCLDGKKRSGSIIIKYSGEYSDTTQLHTVTFDNYTINDQVLNGQVQYTRVDTTVAGNWYYKVKVAETLEVDPQDQSQIITWNGSLVRRWVQGYSTGDRSDDIFSISGSANLTRANGHLFGFNIATPLQFALGCDYAESGVVDVAGYEGGRILNYGSGGCDPNAQLTIDLSTYNIVLTQ